MNIKQQADSYFEMFFIPINEPYDNETCFGPALKCAIIHVEGLIKEHEYNDTLYAVEREITLIEILTELKSRI